MKTTPIERSAPDSGSSSTSPTSVSRRASESKPGRSSSTRPIRPSPRAKRSTSRPASSRRRRRERFSSGRLPTGSRRDASRRSPRAHSSCAASASRLSRSARFAAIDGPPQPNAVTAPFIGRQSELDLLENTYARTLRDRRPQVFTIYGEPGVGKSRLAREFLAGVEGATILTGRALPYGEGITYWPLAEMVKSAAGITDDDPMETAKQKLIECCGDEAIAELLGLASGVMEAVEGERGAAGDRVGSARVRRRARRRAAADHGVRGHPLGRRAAARADRPPRAVGARALAADPLPGTARAARRAAGLGRRTRALDGDRARAAAA